MIKKLSENITNKLVSDSNICDSQKKVYSYGLEYFISLTISFIFAMIITMIMNVWFEAVGFMIGFTLLRSSTGGFHSKTHFWCQISSISLFTIAMLVAKYGVSLFSPSIILMLALLVCLVVFEIAPIEHINRPFSINEFTKFKNMSRIKVISISYVCVLGYMFTDLRGIFIGMLLSMIIVTVSIFLAFMLERSGDER